MFFLHYCLHIKDKVFIVKSNELAFYIFGISNHLLLYVRLFYNINKFQIKIVLASIFPYNKNVAASIRI